MDLPRADHGRAVASRRNPANITLMAARRLQLPARQLSILDPMGSLRAGAKPHFSIGLVFRIVAVKPNNLAVAFEREDMGRDAIEKPAIVGNHHRAAGE